jgi:SAM-dependent methyltransferase
VDADTRRQLASRILDSDGFVSAVFSGAVQGGTRPPWVKVTVRPVLVKGERLLQLEYFDSMKGVARNMDAAAAPPVVDEALELPFRHYYVRTRTDGLQVQVTRRGKALVRTIPLSAPLPEADLSHDRRKHRLVDPSKDGAFLQAVGLADERGKVKPSMQSKYRQVEEFLRILDAGLPPLPEGTPVAAADLGCGNAYLTFALYDHLARRRHLAPTVTGVDTNAQAVERHRGKARDLGWDGCRFEVGTIAGYRPEQAPSIVVALHACDTATDEALSRAMAWRTDLVLSVPCCHHHLQVQLDARRAPAALRPVVSEGLMKERLGDVLTDTLRALLLGVAGYTVRMVQFVSSEHTAKNVMLVARRVDQPASRRDAHREEYTQLRDAFGVTPHLETLLPDEVRAVLEAGPGRDA